MFQFKSIELMNWDFWPHFELPFDERIIMLAGPNGSGKTTFLDSLRLLLGAKTLSTGRKLAKYLRSGDRVAMIKGVVTNPLRHGKRPFRHLGYATEVVSLVCLLENKGGAWEKRFAILAGDVTRDEVEKSTKWFGPEEYARNLHAAGLPRTLLKILALEQGETNKLCQKSPQELLKYLLEIQGDKQTLDRYSDALENYRMSEKELFEQGQKEVAMQKNVMDHERQAVDASAYHAKIGEAERLKTETLPKAIYKDILERSGELQETLGAEEQKLNDIKVQREAVDDALAKVQLDDTAALEQISTVRETSRRILKEKEKFDLEYGSVSADLTRFDKLTDEVSTITPDDGDALTKQLEDKRKLSAKLANDFDTAQARLLELIAEKQSLTTSKTVSLPTDVEGLRRALTDAGIEHVLVAEMIDVRKKEWQRAVESLLGRDRFTVVVKNRDSLKAREIARTQQYKSFISEFEDRPVAVDAPPGSALAVTDFDRNDLPSWIMENLARVQLVKDIGEGLQLGRHVTSITPDGYRQDQRGGIFVGVDRLYCGRSAASDRLKTLEKVEIPGITAQRDQCARDRGVVDNQVHELMSRLTRQRKLAEWREEEALVHFKKLRKEELVKIRRDFTEQALESDNRISAIEQTRRERGERKGELQMKRLRLEEERQNLEALLPAHRTKAVAELAQLEKMNNELPASWRTPEALAEVKSRDAIEILLQRLEDEVVAWTGCKDLAVKEVYDKIKAEYDEFRAFLDKRRAEHARWTEELGLARRSYSRVVEQTVEFYRRAVVKLAEKAGFQIEVPNLALPEDDESLERAGLIVRVAYDGKHFVNIDDPDLSGGQSVLTSLVLLLGMTFADGTEDSTGFFILDEPFAHLSVERIDDVAAFLSATKSQFILTTPTTHNHNVFNPSHLTVALRKKKAGEVEAPAPVFIRR